MAAPKGTLRVSRHGGAFTAQIVGWGCIAQALCLRQAAEQALAGGMAALRLDLRYCTYMDSTFIGTLLFLKRSAEGGRGEFVLVSPSAECEQLLKQMAMAAIFRAVVLEECPESAWSELPTGSDGGDAFRCRVVEAHQELANIDGPAGEPFRRVVRCLNASAPQKSDSQQPT